MFVIVRSLRRRRADILDVGESTLNVGELTVGETTRRRNDRNSRLTMSRYGSENKLDNLDVLICFLLHTLKIIKGCRNYRHPRIIFSKGDYIERLNEKLQI